MAVLPTATTTITTTSIMNETARLTIVGLGPGDPELVTIKGMRAIQTADVIFVPRSQDDADNIARQIAAPWLSERQTVVSITTPMTRDRTALQAAWQQVADDIAAWLLPDGGPVRQGAYLILGNPLLYGTFTYIADRLACNQPQIEIEMIPGVTSSTDNVSKTQPTPMTITRSKRARQPLYPINLARMSGQRAVVVGGGPVGERKVKGLLAVGAQVKVISPEVTVQLQAWADTGRIIWQPRSYQAGDLHGAFLVFAATNQRAINARVAQDAAALNLLSNIADVPEEGDFYLPAVHRQPEVMVAVSTSGQSPGRAARIRDRVAELLATFSDERNRKR